MKLNGNASTDGQSVPIAATRLFQSHATISRLASIPIELNLSMGANARFSSWPRRLFVRLHPACPDQKDRAGLERRTLRVKRALEFFQRINILLQWTHRPPLPFAEPERVDEHAASDKFIGPVMDPQSGVPISGLFPLSRRCRTAQGERGQHGRRPIPLTAFPVRVGSDRANRRSAR